MTLTCQPRVVLLISLLSLSPHARPVRALSGCGEVNEPDLTAAHKKLNSACEGKSERRPDTATHTTGLQRLQRKPMGTIAFDSKTYEPFPSKFQKHAAFPKRCEILEGIATLACFATAASYVRRQACAGAQKKSGKDTQPALQRTVSSSLPCHFCAASHAPAFPSKIDRPRLGAGK